MLTTGRRSHRRQALPLGKIWREIVLDAFERIGGSGSLGEIYTAVEGMFIEADQEPPATWKAVVRREIEYNSSDSDSFQNRYDLFRATHGIGAGHWSLRGYESGPEHTEEIVISDEAERKNTYISRIVRDGRKVRSLKKIHNDTCQLCSTRMLFPDGSSYSEVHHLKPLGRPHNGPDVETNMIVVCPVCHVLLDYGARQVRVEEVIRSKHKIGSNFVDYNNSLTRWIVDPIE